MENLAIDYHHTHTTSSALRDLHYGVNDSYITLATMNAGNYNQHHYLGVEKTVSRALELKQDNIDIYHSANSFYMPKRSKVTLFTLDSLYLDIDCHKGGFDPHAALYFLKSNFFEVSIPTPTYTIFTGRGLQLYWKIESAPRQAVATWEVLQEQLADMLEELNDYMPNLNVDRQCLDVTRVLRVPYTKNMKVNKVAEIIDHFEYTYTMSEIFEGYFPDLIPLNKKTKNPLRTNKAYTPHTNKVIKVFNAYTLLMARVNDFRTLIELREGDLQGMRDMFLFMYAWTVIKKTDTFETLYRELDGINSLFKTPLPDKEVKKKAKHIYAKYKSDVLKKEKPTQTYEKYNRYVFKNVTIIKRLNITLDEQRQLSTIISKEIKYERNNRIRTPRNEQGLTKKQQETTDRRKAVAKYLQMGYKQKQIADILNISVETIKNDRKALAKSGVKNAL